MKSISVILCTAIITALYALPVATASDAADVIYFGGSIITINDAQPTVEAVAVRDGRIVALASKEDVLAMQNTETRLVDLGGRTMLPGFVDAHGHVMGGGLQALSANLLAPPDGDVKDIASLQQTLRDWMAENQKVVEKVNLVIGFGYDNAQLDELRHPVREDLDAVSDQVPIVLVHQSGHIISANSVALSLGGITADTPNPTGGVIRRQEDGKEPNGVLEETAAFPLLLKVLGGLGRDGSKVFLRAGTELWARYGYTTAQDGRTMPAAVNIIKEFAADGGLKIDVVAYPDVLVDRDLIKKEASRVYTNRFRVGGAKLTIDGSPQGFTAWRDRPYYKPVGDYPPGYSGYAAATVPQVADAIDWAYQNDIQIITHANGEAASDLLIAYIDAATRQHGAGDRRPVLIHGQFLREDQVDAFNRLGVFFSLFPMHTFYWGDWHREHTVGPELADDISPTGWCMKRGIMFTTHHDAPVAFPNSMRVMDATVTRRSRSGDIIGPEHRVDVMTALKAMTLWAAFQHFEEDSKGSIEIGKLADFVILDKNPLLVDPETLDQIRVVETIKEGVTVFRLKDDSEQGAKAFYPESGRSFGCVLELASLGTDKRHHELHYGSCYCGALSRLCNIMAQGE